MADEEWDWVGSIFDESGYHEFARSVKHDARYVHRREAREFLTKVLETLPARRGLLKTGLVLCRAQRGFTLGQVEGEECDREMAHPPERMVPTPEHCLDGRVSPRGIPCLYLASNMKTAVAEVRPWVDAYVSLAQFKIVKECRVVDCRAAKSDKLDKQQALIWSDIAYAFSKPMSPEEPHLEYVPTQILAETFREHGFDGLVYESLLNKGTNIALFDPKNADLMNCGLHKIRAVNFDFALADNPYFMTQHYPEIEAQIAGREAQPAEALEDAQATAADETSG
jgi:RES domain-containing protein